MKEYHETVEGSESELASAYRSFISKGLKPFFLRFFCTDPAAQRILLAKLFPDVTCPVSFIGQPPLGGASCGMWLWATDEEPSEAYSHHFDVNMTAPGSDSRAQMDSIFRNFESGQNSRGLKTADDCVRTWIFVRNIDDNYGGVVVGRREYFDTIGLTAQTHYISSTGIQGDSPDPEALVQMDAYSVGGLAPGQIAFLYGKTHLNPTYEYGVTFERGTSVTYGDRKHVFISGTASIDNKGQVLHVGDVSAQTERMLENISVLLAEAGASLEDVGPALVYLRNAGDLEAVRSVFKRVCPFLKPIFLLAPVCRPTWLVETECIACVPEGDSRYPRF